MWIWLGEKRGLRFSENYLQEYVKKLAIFIYLQIVLDSPSFFAFLVSLGNNLAEIRV